MKGKKTQGSRMRFKSKKTNLLKSFKAGRTKHQPVIYYIEDSDLSRKLTSAMIETWNYDVVAEESPVAVLIDIVIDKIDCIVMDFSLRGFEPIHYIPLIEKAGVPIVFYSGHDGYYIKKYFRDNNYKLGTDIGFITKPYIHELKNYINSLLFDNNRDSAILEA